eukprot:756399-Hanusia_phi.AAC.2
MLECDKVTKLDSSLVSVGEVDTAWREQHALQVVCTEEESCANENETSEEKADVRLDECTDQDRSESGLEQGDLHVTLHETIVKGGSVFLRA